MENFTAVMAPSAGDGTALFYPAILSSAGIQAAIFDANAAGGGTVQLSATTIPLQAPLTMLSGVKIKGVPPQPVYNTIPDSGLTTLVGSAGGTVLAPTGAFPAITWNTAALPVPASQTAFTQTGLTNIAVEDLGFSGGTYGIFAGATNNASCWYSQFKNLYFTGQTVVGINVTNYQHCQFNGNYSFGCAWGQYHAIDVSSASLAPGNSTYYDLYNCITASTAGQLQRGISFITTATTGGAADNNQFKFDRVQSNRFGGTTITQAATMVNTQANITITDGTKFAVGVPATVDATQNGFTLKKIYFVISVVGNVIQLSLTYGGAAVLATGAVAVNIVTQGFPCFEMIALAGSANTNVVMDNVDVEGFSTAAMFFQNCTGLNIQMSQVPGVGQATQSMCFRGCVNKLVIAPQSISTDDDQNAVGAASMILGAKFGTSIGYQGMGIWYDSVSGKSVFSLGSQNDSQSAGLLTYDPATNTGICLPKNAGIGQLPKLVNSASFAVSALNVVVCNQASAAVNTLPTVTAANAGAWIEFVNHTAGTQTVATDGTQLFNGITARTVITLNAGATVRLSAVNIGAFTWDVMGGTSAMVAGVISAPT